MALRWYVVHVYSGSEKKVAEAIRDQIVRKGMQDLISEVLVPTEEVVEVRRGVRINSERRSFSLAISWGIWILAMKLGI
jgi:transcriptional antiterminator NusG